MLELPRMEWLSLAAITLLTAVLAAKLFWVRLASSYPAFTAFLVFSVARVVVLGLVKMGPTMYRYYYIGTEAVQLGLYILMVLELYRHVFNQYPGIRTVSQWVLGGALAASLVVSFLTLSADMAGRPRLPLAMLDQFMIAERGVVSTLVLMMLVVTAFLAYYPVRLPLNLVVHSGVFAVYFLSKSGMILYRNITAEKIDRTISLGIMGLAGICLCTWLVMLSRKGEAKSTVVGHLWDRGEEERLIAQLKGVNSALARMSRE